MWEVELSTPCQHHHALQYRTRWPVARLPTVSESVKFQVPVLDDAHGALDAVVAATYGWSPEVIEDDALRELPKMNRAT